MNTKQIREIANSGVVIWQWIDENGNKVWASCEKASQMESQTKHKYDAMVLHCWHNDHRATTKEMIKCGCGK